MEFIDRYLHAVRFWLPPAQQDDIAAEIADDIGSELAAAEAELGRPLNDADILALLKRRGRPMLVATRYLPQRPLIGPSLLPSYFYLLKMIALWVLLPLYAFVIGPLEIASAGPAAIALIIWNYLSATVFTTGMLTLVFAFIERYGLATLCDWDPRRLPPVNRSAERNTTSRLAAVAEITIGLFWLAAWLYVIRVRPSLELEHLRVTLAPVWHTLAAPIAVLFAAGAVIGLVSLVRPDRIVLRSTLRLLLHAYSLLLVWTLVAAGSWFEVTPNGLDANVVPGILQGIDIGLQITFFSIAATVVFDAVAEVRRLMRRGLVTSSASI